MSSDKEKLDLERQAEQSGYHAEDRPDPKDRELDRALRKSFAYTLLWIHGAVNLVVMTLVVAIAFKWKEASLSDKVLITLIASTVAELAGIVLAVAKYLFPASGGNASHPTRKKPSAKKLKNSA